MSNSEDPKKIPHTIIPGILCHTGGVTATKIFIAIERILGISYTKMIEKTRRREVVEARQIYMTLMRKHTSSTLKEVGDKINLDHATVMHGIRVVKNYLEVDSKFADSFNAIEQVLLAGTNCDKYDSSVEIRTVGNAKRLAKERQYNNFL